MPRNPIPKETAQRALRSAPAVYVFSRPKLVASILSLKEALASSKLSIVIPVKSCPEPRLLRAAGLHLEGFEVSNEAEARLIRARRNQLVIVHDPSGGYRPASPNFLCVQEFPGPASAEGIRINVGADPAGQSSRFGTPFPEALSAFEQSAQWRGIHFHNGWENHSLARLRWMIQRAIQLQNAARGRLRWVSLGGGLATIPPQHLPLAGRLAEELSRHGFETILFEPGRWLTEQAGSVAARVTGTFPFHDGTAVCLSLSFLCHLRWERPSLPREAKGEKKIYFFGASCAEADRMVASMSEAYYRKLMRDKVVWFGTISGYALAWNQSFNGIGAAKLLVH